MITRLPERVLSFDRFNKMMEDVFSGAPSVWTPLVDVKETLKEIVLVAELPGLLEKDVEIEMVGDILTITGHREFNNEEKRDDYVRIERGYGSFKRSFTIDVPIKPDLIKATFKDGLLTVTLPKAEARPTKKIPIIGAK